MKRISLLLAVLMLMLALAGCGGGSAATGEGGAAATLFAVNVGKGDALILRAGDSAVLIDAGKARARGRVRSALTELGVQRLDAVFLTHTDNDHAGGLAWLAESDIPVGKWYAPAMYTGVKEKKHPMVLAAAVRGEDVEWLRRGDEISLGGGATLRVLAPASLFEDKDDNNSLVMMLETAQGRMLLTGDMELPEEAELLDQGDDLKCAVLKAPNHGDGDSTSKAFAKACAAQIAVISTDGVEKPGTPDPGVVSRLEKAGSRVISTEDSGLGVLVTLSGGAASAANVAIDAPEVSGVEIAWVDADDDRVDLVARDETDLTGCYLHSERGNELFAFPDGTVIGAGRTLTVGTRSTDGDYDLLWDDKNVINAKKGDEIVLYDAWGREVDRMAG